MGDALLFDNNKKGAFMNAQLLTEGAEPLAIIPQAKSDEFNAYVRKYGFTCRVQLEGFCDENVFEFSEDAEVFELTRLVESFPLN